MRRYRVIDSRASFSTNDTYHVAHLTRHNGEFGGPDFYQWDQNGAAYNLVGYSDPTFHSEMNDVKSEGVWKFNDVDQIKRIGHYTCRPFSGVTPGQLIYLTAPGATPSEGQAGFTETCEHLCRQVKLACSRVIGDYPLKSVEALFQNSTLPHKITIDRDPFETNFSFWYTVVDLIDLKKLFTKLLKNLAKPSFSRHSLPKKATARKLADGHLGTRFGVIPTVSDISETINLINGWQSTYSQMDAFLSKRFRKHERVDFSATYPFDDWDLIVPFQTEGTPNISLTCLVSSRSKVRWHGMALYGFTCPEFQGWLARLCQICDSFGVLDPSALWDVIPFSFIVDWFFTTNSYFHKLKPRLFPATAVVYDYLETVKVVTTVTYTLTWRSPFVGSRSASLETSFEDRNDFIGAETYTTYVRRRYKPEINNVVLSPEIALKKSFVSCSHVAIAASLAAQRIPR